MNLTKFYINFIIKITRERERKIGKMAFKYGLLIFYDF